MKHKVNQRGHSLRKYMGWLLVVAFLCIYSFGNNTEPMNPLGWDGLNLSYFGFSVAASDDIMSDWAEEEIKALKATGKFRFSAFGDYSQEITRLDFIYIVVRVYELLDGETVDVVSGATFKDTSDRYTKKAAIAGITDGIGNGYFGPYLNLTREELATFMVRALTLLDKELNQPSKYLFEDDTLISSWARESVYVSRSNSIIEGVGDNRMDPQGTTTVEMALVVAFRILDKYGYW
jgi:hypothetical protein